MSIFNTRTLLGIAEPFRAGLEFTALATSPWLSLAPKGDGHPVVVLPGFLASDDSTWVLRQFLQQRGYQVHPWAMGRNLGAARLGGYDGLISHIQDIHARSGRRISLIGWSLGGVHALAVAHQVGHIVRQVITLGSPLARPVSSVDESALYQALRVTARRINGVPVYTPRPDNLAWRDGLANLSPDLSVSAIYSRSDGVVPWQRARLNLDVQKRRENIEVISSHIGLGVHPAVFYALADRLAQAEGDFAPFHRRGWRGLVYPTTASAYQIR